MAVLKCLVQVLVLAVVLVDALDSFLLDEVPDCPAVHCLHQEGLKVVIGEPEIEIQLGMLFDLLPKPVYLHLHDYRCCLFLIEARVTLLSQFSEELDVIALVFLGKVQS